MRPVPVATSEADKPRKMTIEEKLTRIHQWALTHERICNDGFETAKRKGSNRTLAYHRNSGMSAVASRTLRFIQDVVEDKQVTTNNEMGRVRETLENELKRQ